MTTCALSFKNGLLMPEHFPVTRGAAQNSSQDIAASFVAGHNAVADQKGHRAAVIGNDPDGNIVVGIFAVGFAGCFFDKADDRSKQIGIVIALDALNDGGEALQSHARIDVGFGQRR